MNGATEPQYRSTRPQTTWTLPAAFHASSYKVLLLSVTSKSKSVLNSNKEGNAFMIYWTVIRIASFFVSFCSLNEINLAFRNQLKLEVGWEMENNERIQTSYLQITPKKKKKKIEAKTEY